ncbi:uncharacterized protein K452DRAFT_267597 [Aplosporella prunicola CBS 121167]|uniref:Cytochrome P450 n=1 Tax=Aplosporella prunicola CBS 121167 TaxID=1176127 RepID=A0A6A6BJI6_9PEZI|nr:uncharacterized protein K452DRAFT_267597 [Aplosporella prunicola CBS 121167]KAF2144309.1 hypothetical protein K452DRAFT_267597 [Aplosporella prunicola CBS 121167]
MDTFLALPPSAYFCIAAVSIFVLAHRYSAHPTGSREPPFIPSRLPLIGHLICMLWYGKDYYRMIDEKYGYDIYTLPIFGQSFYVVAGPSMVAAVNRIPKAVSVHPISSALTQSISGLPEKVGQVNLVDEDDQDIHIAHHDILYSMLPQGTSMDEIAQELLNGVAKNLDYLSENQLDLYLFTRRLVGTSIMSALYGPGFPVEDPSFVSDYWAFDPKLLDIIVSPFPQITAPKAYHLRETLAKKFITFFENGLDKSASFMMRTRYELYRKYGYTLEDIARTEVIFTVGILSNSSITAFWYLSYALSDPNLFKELSDEASKACVRDGDEAVVDMTKIRSTSDCPLLNSVLREILRHIMHSGAPRKILSDTMVNDQYLLKKGSFLMTEASVLHNRTSIWGDDVAEFNPRRFYNSPNGTASDGKRVHPAAYRAFGGGDVLCPGRNLVRDGIIGLAVAVLLGFDVTNVDGSPLTKPQIRYDKMPTSVFKPAHEVPVCIRRKAGWENVQWEYRL